MVRCAALLMVVCGVMASTAVGAQVSSSFQVGITIGGARQKALLAPPAARTYTWGAAAVSLKLAGFEEPRRVERSDTLYWFIAKKAGGRFRVAVSITSGAIVKVIPA